MKHDVRRPVARDAVAVARRAGALSRRAAALDGGRRSAPSAGVGRARAAGLERADGEPAGAHEHRQGRGQAQPHRVGGLHPAASGSSRSRQQTGCQVNAKYAGTSSEMVSLMANGGGGQYDLVSASGDADLRLIYGGDVRPVNIDLIPSWKDFHPFLQSPSFNTIDGKHYGVSFQFGPNVLLYSTTTFTTAPTSWSVIYDSKYKGKVTVPEQPDPDRRRGALPVEDEAEARHHRSLRADAAAVRRGGQPAEAREAADQEVLEPRLGGDLAVPERHDGRRRGVAVPDGHARRPTGARSPTRSRRRARPAGPTPGCSPTKAPHPNCAYKWMKYISTPKPQAQQADSFGETPANTQACPIMNKIAEGLAAPASTPTSPSRTSRRSSSGRRRSRSATTARTTACRSRSGSPPGRRSSARPGRSRWRATRLSEDRPMTGVARVSAALWRRPWLRATLTLTPPLAWFLVIYLASLALMLVTAFWSVEPVHEQPRAQLTLANFRQLFTAHLPDDHLAHGRDGGARHGHRRGDRAAVRLLHGARRVAARCASCCSWRCCCRSGRATSRASTRGS